jgi:hypothetical protein
MIAAHIVLRGRISELEKQLPLKHLPGASGRHHLTATMPDVDRAHMEEASLWLRQQWNWRK